MNDLKLRQLKLEDFENLHRWLNAPHVLRWWDGAIDRAEVQLKYEPRLQADSASKVFIIEIDEQAVGFIQCYKHCDYPDWNKAVAIDNCAGIDYLIGESHFTGKGIGTKAIQAICKSAFELYGDINTIVSVPQKDNLASWKALEKAGFSRIDERKLDSNCPSDSGVSYIYSFNRQSQR